MNTEQKTRWATGCGAGMSVIGVTWAAGAGMSPVSGIAALLGAVLLSLGIAREW